jgi:hypothetical protein
VAGELNSATSVNWRAGVLALGVRIAIQQKVSLEGIYSTVTELKAAHLQNRSSGGEDFEAHALALGLQYCGMSEEAFRLLSEYAATHRRERWPLPKQLSDLLRLLRASYADSAKSKTEALSSVA